MRKPSTSATPNRTAKALRGGVSAVEMPDHVLVVEFHDSQLPLAASLFGQLAKEAHPGHTREAPEWRYDLATGFHRITMAKEPCRRALADISRALARLETGEPAESPTG